MSATTDDNPLAADGPPADIELQEAGPFPLTLKDMFTNSYVVEARPEMPVHEVKELVRAAKKEEAEGKLAAAREDLAQLEAEAARAQARPEQAALEARKVANSSLAAASFPSACSFFTTRTSFLTSCTGIFGRTSTT